MQGLAHGGTTTAGSRKSVRLMLSCLSALILASLLASSCASSDRLAEGQVEIKRVSVVSDRKSVKGSVLMPYIRQRPGRVNGKRQHLALDTTETRLSCEQLRGALANGGFLHATVTAETAVRPHTASHRNPLCDVTYRLHTGTPYTLASISYNIEDRRIDSLLRPHLPLALETGQRFSVAKLNEERAGVVKFLGDRGFYDFNKEFVTFVADTTATSDSVRLTLNLAPYRASSSSHATPHTRYAIGSISYLPSSAATPFALRPGVLDENTALVEGRPFSSTALQQTYQRFARLSALRYTNIRFTPASGDSLTSGTDKTLDCDIILSPRKPNSISIQPEGTNTAGDLGAAVSLTYENRNLFHGSELFSLSLRGAYEAITGLEGYNNDDYIEYGVEGKIQFPRFLFPFISRTFRRSILSTSELSVAYNLQNRPEFHRRMFSAAWRYRWAEPRHHSSYVFDVLDLNYIHMPWISDTFKHDYLDSLSNHNAILRYNYSDLFIMKMGIGVTYNNGVNALKANFEFAGNVLHAISHLCSFRKNDDGQYTLFNIAYAQYVKLDVDATRITRLTPSTELVIHGGLGIAYPYGNSSILPFEKRYFAGGANSVRGWAVRELGPGTYSGTDGRIDFINQTGDIRLDLNAELRTHLFWKIDGAAFIDAGNIWTIRDYENQPGGQFHFSSFLKQMAAAYGLGLRLNFNYFILRFDAGMKAVDPAAIGTRYHYPLVRPRLSRDFTFHFAVGMPF